MIAYVFLPRLYLKLAAGSVSTRLFHREGEDEFRSGSDVVNMAWDGPEDNIHSAMQAAQVGHGNPDHTGFSAGDYPLRVDSFAGP